MGTQRGRGVKRPTTEMRWGLGVEADSGGVKTLIQTAADRVTEGRHADAVEMLLPTMRRGKGDAAVAYLLGLSLVRLGRAPEALEWLKQAADYRPPQVDALVEYGCALFDCGHWDDGLAQLRGAVGAFPHDARARVVLAKMLHQGGLFVPAMEQAMHAMQRAPQVAEPVSVFASCLAGLGYAEEAVEWFARAVATDPNDLRTRANLCHALNAAGGIDPGEVCRRHRELGAMIAERASTGRPHTNARAPGKRLRIGLLSPDFREHPVARFILPLLRHARNHELEFVAYSSSVRGDGTTDLVRAAVDAWRDVSGLDDTALADLIRRDGVDVLVDLAGHTGGTRLAVLASRPAPVQLTYLGYANTTGLPGVDVRLVDWVTDPLGAEAFATERLVRLDGCLVCFDPTGCGPDEGGPVAPPPALARGVVTFGSFNNATKTSGATLALWAGVLRAVPGARLALKGKGLDEPTSRGVVERRLSQAGIDPSRVEILGYRGAHLEHLRAYAEVDVALDTHPYSGTTTTCEALWMGVPVVTLTGRSHASRVSASVLQAAGCPEWATGNAEEYARIAAGLAADLEGLRALRSGLRERVRASGLCDAAGFARGWAAAVRGEWARWCRASGVHSPSHGDAGPERAACGGPDLSGQVGAGGAGFAGAGAQGAI
ncbi:MAG: hypothetical protein DYG92_09585 [Leptolyngbya sp. PLA1]|nr:hypothetical protein [Leptolyngbya sp. PLA1]